MRLQDGARDTKLENRMRSTLLALATLSVFALVQNVVVVAATPAPTGPTAEAQLISADAEIPRPFFSPAPSESRRDAPAPGTLSLFAAGIAGLTVAGGRRQERENAVA